jgi:hypothetical protein
MYWVDCNVISQAYTPEIQGLGTSGFTPFIDSFLSVAISSLFCHKPTIVSYVSSLLSCLPSSVCNNSLHSWSYTYVFTNPVISTTPIIV